MGIFFRTTLLTALCCVFCISAKAQQYTLKDSVLVDSLINQAIDAFYNNPLVCDSIASKALSIAKDINYDKGQISLYNILSVANRSMGNVKLGMEYSQKNIELNLAQKTRGDSTNAYFEMSNLASSNSQMGNYAIALELCSKSMQYLDQVGDTQGMIASRSVMASIYKHCGENDAAHQLFDEELAILKSANLGDDNVSLQYYSEEGNIYMFKAEMYKDKELYDSAISLINKAQKVFKDLGNELKYKLAQGILADVYIDQKKYDEAYPLILSTLHAAEERGMMKQMAVSHLQMCMYYSEKQNYDSAIYHGTKSYEIAEKLDNLELIGELYYEMGKLYNQQGEHEKAVDALLKHMDIKDSLLSESVYRKLQAELFDKQLRKKEQEKQNALIENESKAETIRFWKIAGSILIIATIITIVLGIRLNNSRKKYLSAVKSLSHNNQVKNRLLAIISHDLRSPLSSLHGVVALTKQKALSDEDKERLFNKVEQNLNVTLSLVDNLLYWTKNQINEIEAHIEPFDIEKIISSTIDVYGPQAKEKNISVNINLSAHTNVLGDRGMINIVIRNLVSNAVKFTKSGGVIDIVTKTNGNKLEVKVSDTGLGIKPEKIDGLFTDLNKSELGTNKEKGTGLGLPVSYEFIKLNHSKLKIDSTLGQGTTFYFDLPLHN